MADQLEEVRSVLAPREVEVNRESVGHARAAADIDRLLRPPVQQRPAPQNRAPQNQRAAAKANIASIKAQMEQKAAQENVWAQLPIVWSKVRSGGVPDTHLETRRKYSEDDLRIIQEHIGMPLGQSYLPREIPLLQVLTPEQRQSFIAQAQAKGVMDEEPTAIPLAKLDERQLAFVMQQIAKRNMEAAKRIEEEARKKKPNG